MEKELTAYYQALVQMSLKEVQKAEKGLWLARGQMNQVDNENNLSDPYDVLKDLTDILDRISILKENIKKQNEIRN